MVCYLLFYFMRYYVIFVIVDKLTNHIQKIIGKVREAFLFVVCFCELLLHITLKFYLR